MATSNTPDNWLYAFEWGEGRDEGGSRSSRVRSCSFAALFALVSDDLEHLAASDDEPLRGGGACHSPLRRGEPLFFSRSGLFSGAGLLAAVLGMAPPTVPRDQDRSRRANR